MGISIATESISYLWDYMTERARRFPAPWTVEEHRGISYIVRDANNFAVAYVYFEEDQLLRTGVNLMSKDEARKIAASIALLPELLGAEPKPDANALVQRR
jgi:hypothetical protein